MQVGADDVVAVMHTPEPAPQATPAVGVGMPHSAAREVATLAVQPMFTLEQMQTMAQLPAQAAVDSLRVVEQAAKCLLPQLTPRTAAPELTLVQTPARRVA